MQIETFIERATGMAAHSPTPILTLPIVPPEIEDPVYVVRVWSKKPSHLPESVYLRRIRAFAGVRWITAVVREARPCYLVDVRADGSLDTMRVNEAPRCFAEYMVAVFDTWDLVPVWIETELCSPAALA